MIDVFGNIKFIDVGVSRLLATKHAEEGRTVIGASMDNGFVAPEMLAQLQNEPTEPTYSYSIDSDIFSLGRTLLSLTFCTMEKMNSSQFRKQQILEFQEETPHAGLLLADLTSRMTKVFPTDRLSLSDALRHPFFWSSDKCISFIANVGSWLQNLSDRDFNQRGKVSQALDDGFQAACKCGLCQTVVPTDLKYGAGWWKLFGDYQARFKQDYQSLSGTYDDSKGWLSLLTMVRDHAPGHHQKFLIEPDSSMLLDCVPFLTVSVWTCVEEHHRTHPNFRFVFQ